MPTGIEKKSDRVNEQRVGSDNFRKKIVHLTTVHPPFDVRIFHKECKSIARAGYDVTLIACHEKDEMCDGVRIQAVPKTPGRLSRMIRGVWKVYREAVYQDADLYHFHDPELLLIGLLLRMKGKIVVYDVHEDVSEDVATKVYIPPGFRHLLAWAVGSLEAFSSRFFSAVVSVTPRINRRFQRRNQNSVIVSNYPVLEIHRGVAQRPWMERSSSVVYAGVIAEDRCVFSMVDAINLLPEEAQVTLKLAGTFSPEKLHREVAGTAGWRRVEYLGHIDRAHVRELFDNVRAGLLLYRPDPNSLECAPNKLFEYMQAGIPIIASDLPGFRTIINGARCGILVDPCCPQVIANAIEYVIDHPQEAEEMGRRGCDEVLRRFNWASEEQKLLDLYRKLLNTL
jgi:glycosyltransferase involved in cell wall biosynthesis